ncbi:MAG: malto-oligosyltrehalose synthase [Betaproteobacteria bacterium]
MSDALSRLSAAYGIAGEYDDVWGNRHRVADATQVTLLAAMGVAARDDATATEALAKIDVARAAQRVAPLVVLRENRRPWILHLRLPPALAAGPLSVRVTAEDGAHCNDAAVAIVRREPPAYAGSECVNLEVALTATLPQGYHVVEFLAGTEEVARTCCAVAPAACYRAASPGDDRAWGAAAQLYAVRSSRNWGIGDFTDLATLVDQWGQRGAGFVGLNPLHALFPAMPERASPYSPSSRLFRNVLYIDVEAVPELRDCAAARSLVASAEFQERLSALRAADLVDYAGVAAVKREALELLYRHFRGRYVADSDARADAFRAYVAAGGAALRTQALFDALHEHFHAKDNAVQGWRAWPPAYRDPHGQAVKRFAASHAERVEFHAYLQWQAEQQFVAAGERARAAGLAIGLFTDLAVSIDRGGAEAWASQDLYALDANVGAPPDVFSPNGQDWGLPPILPGRLRDDAYAPFLATLRANMRHAGALRIDHVMGLSRLYWVPAGGNAADGAYVQYPFDDLLGLLALESHRHHCLVIGEDLGTVPDALRAALADNGILSYRALIFERDGNDEFKPPAAYPSEALATFSTHDLPTLASWWSGADIALRAAHGLVATDAERDRQTRERDKDRHRLLAALVDAGLVPNNCHDPATNPVLDPELALAVQAYLALTPARLHQVQLEDVLGVTEQANLPGTIDAHPNWRRKLPLSLERWPEDDRFIALATALARVRPRPSPATPLPAPPLHVPLSTYRVQLGPAFTFGHATALIPYLAALGISHVYCSPYLRARTGSLHGYDIVDHATLNPELGSRAQFEQFVAALAERGMGHICDVVPNHVGVMGADNGWWMDVLEHGPASACADYFDIDWTPFDAELTGKLLVPVLGDPYGAVLERGELRLAFESATGTFAIDYFGHRFPIDPKEYPTLLTLALERAATALPPPVATAGTRLLRALHTLPPRSATAPDAVALRKRAATAAKAELAMLAADHPVLADAISDAMETFNGIPGQPATFEPLHALLEAQAFRLAYWRVAADEINYRRFFDINDLAALRMENAVVFDATHTFILELAAAGKIHGLRIDHPDGLFDPEAYFRQLQARYQALVAKTATPGGALPAPIYIVLEKIASSHEQLPPDWPVSGTTGYRFANLVNGLFVAGDAKTRLDRTWRAFVGTEALDYETTIRRSRRAIMRGSLAAELTMLTQRALRVARADRQTRDFTFNVLRRAIEDIVAHFPVYRTYVSERGLSTQDRHYIEWAVVRAQRESRAADGSVFQFLRALMLGSSPEGSGSERDEQYLAFAMRFQQFTSPVAAKGVEDTAFYTFNRLVSLNDVGGDPDQFGTTVEAFHSANEAQAGKWPATLLATSTHDNKRSEDVRARIDVISEIPAAWQRMVHRWRRLNRAHKRRMSEQDAPSASDEYLLYQTLVGTLPTGAFDNASLSRYRERIRQYVVKSAREAKVRTSWFGVNAEYEEALATFVAALLQEGDNRFLADLRRQCDGFAWFGMLNSLSMALAKVASPGVPDIYQGNELLEFQLVDPDNRTPVNYDLRRAQLAQLEGLARGPASAMNDAIASWFAGNGGTMAKLWLTYRLLRFRAAYPSLLATGSYRPVAVSGARADHVVAFTRSDGHGCAIAVAGRLYASLGVKPHTLPLGKLVWGDTVLELAFLPPRAVVSNVLTRERLTVHDGRLLMADAFRLFPGALLHCLPE